VIPILPDIYGKNMQMRSKGIEMTVDDVRLVTKTDAVHILLCDPGHKTAVELVCRGKADRDLYSGLFVR
jgi:hypothetical protein